MTREPLGRAAGDVTDADDGAADDFAVEHEDTAVDKSITSGRDRHRRESESPHGWAGLEARDWSGN
ncbi:hypothetical protein AB0J74_34320 [Asanoa sp. NPDC049573]|uniref:hypothetical protein n=1 Tax=Asanoa sp. NPDC049573 TaxID=3155396 RepID=UPI00342BD3EC